MAVAGPKTVATYRPLATGGEPRLREFTIESTHGKNDNSRDLLPLARGAREQALVNPLQIGSSQLARPGLSSGERTPSDLRSSGSDMVKISLTDPVPVPPHRV